MDKTVVIACSIFGMPVSDFYHSIAKELIEYNVRTVFILDHKPEKSKIPETTAHIKYYTWPNRRPTTPKDALFVHKLLLKYKPILTISNFGATNVLSIASYFHGIKNRVNYLHTTSGTIINNEKSTFKKYDYHWIRKWFIYKLNTILFTNSQGAKTDFINFYGIDKNKIKVFPFFVNSIYEQNQVLSFAERRREILIVGKLLRNKGQKELIDQFEICIKRGLDINLRIVGDGECMDLLIKQVNSSLVKDRITFTGYLEPEAIDEVFRNALIHVSSSYDEAFGLVNIESLQRATPIICTRTLGAEMILEEGENGLFFDHHKSDSLYDSVSTILSNWEHYSHHALQCYQSNYSLNLNLTKRIETLCEIMQIDFHKKVLT